jgi:hypothetical protein
VTDTRLRLAAQAVVDSAPEHLQPRIANLRCALAEHAEGDASKFSKWVEVEMAARDALAPPVPSGPGDEHTIQGADGVTRKWYPGTDAPSREDGCKCGHPESEHGNFQRWCQAVEGGKVCGCFAFEGTGSATGGGT